MIPLHLRTFIALLLCLLCLQIAAAQDVPRSVEPCRDAAQLWYASISADITLQLSVMMIDSGNAPANVLAGADLAVDQSLSSVEDLDYPDCIEQPRQWYLQGTRLLWQAYQALYISRSHVDFAVLMARGMQSIGQFRGYLAALGVTLDAPEGAVLFYK